jgi:hypothetical protein
MAWKAQLMAVDVGSNAVSARILVTNTGKVLDAGPPIVYQTFSLSKAFTAPNQIVVADILAWIRTEIIRIKSLEDAAQVLVGNIGTVVNLS